MKQTVKTVSVTPDAEKNIAYCARVSNPNNQDNENISRLLKYCIDNSRLKDLGFSPQIDLTTGLNEVFDFVEKNSQRSLIN